MRSLDLKDKNILITGISGFVGSRMARRLVEGDLESISSIGSAITASEPDFIFHLAAQSFVPRSFVDPNETMLCNCRNLEPPGGSEDQRCRSNSSTRWEQRGEQLRDEPSADEP